MQYARYIGVFLIILGFIGFLDASYLAASHYSGTSLACSVIEGCEEVTTSAYASVAGVPVASIGVLYYFAVTLLAFAFFRNRSRAFILTLTAITGAGFLATLWFVYIQLFILHAVCVYCMVSAVTSTLLFALSLFLATKTKSPEAYPETAHKEPTNGTNSE